MKQGYGQGGGQGGGQGSVCHQMRKVGGRRESSSGGGGQLSREDGGSIKVEKSDRQVKRTYSMQKKKNTNGVVM